MRNIIPHDLKQKRLNELYNLLQESLFNFEIYQYLNVEFKNSNGQILLNNLYDLYDLLCRDKNIFDIRNGHDIIYGKKYLEFFFHGTLYFPKYDYHFSNNNYHFPINNYYFIKKRIYYNNLHIFQYGYLKRIYRDDYKSHISLMLYLINILQIEYNLFSQEKKKENINSFMNNLKNIKIPLKILIFFEKCFEKKISIYNEKIEYLKKEIENENNLIQLHNDELIKKRVEQEKEEKILKGILSEINENEIKKNQLIMEIEKEEKKEIINKKVNEYKNLSMSYKNYEENKKKIEDLKNYINDLSNKIKENEKNIIKNTDKIKENENYTSKLLKILKIIKISILLHIPNDLDKMVINELNETNNLDEIISVEGVYIENS